MINRRGFLLGLVASPAAAFAAAGPAALRTSDVPPIVGRVGAGQEFATPEAALDHLAAFPFAAPYEMQYWSHDDFIGISLLP